MRPARGLGGLAGEAGVVGGNVLTVLLLLPQDWLATKEPISMVLCSEVPPTVTSPTSVEKFWLA